MISKLNERYGYFSLENASNSAKFAGKIIKNEAGLVLELMVMLDGAVTEFPDDDEISAIYGILDNGKHISFHQCYKRATSFGTKHLGVQYYFLKAFLGDEYILADEKISSLTFTTNHLFLWTNGHRGFKKTPDMATRSCTLNYKNPGDIKYKISSNKQMITGFNLTIPGWSQEKSDYEIKARPFIQVKSGRAIKFDLLLEDVFKIVRFISFCVLDRVKILTLRASQGSKDYECYIESSLFTNGADVDGALDRSHQMRIIFTQDEILHHVKNPISKWVEFEEKYGEVSRLFYQSLNINDLPLENLIINLTTALESYRRIRNPGSDVCLKDAILEIAKMHRLSIRSKCKITNITKWSQSIADTRNYYAHIAPNKEKKRLKGGKLYSAIINERHLLIAVVLEELGLSTKAIRDTFKKAFY